MSEERRQFQRLVLREPLDGWFGDYAVRLLDVSANGALIESEDVIPDGARALLRFFWRGREMELIAETARTADSRCGLKFDDHDPVLRDLLAESARELAAAFEANARGDRAANVVGDETITAASRSHATGYVMWIFDGNAWKARPALLPDQPENGFTISAGEAADQVELLRRTYETGDAEARKMTRLLAELSAANHDA